MRTPLFCALSVFLLLASGCSRESAPTAGAEKAAPQPAQAPPPAAPAAAPAAAKDAVFSQEELDQMVAPIALYPDPLLAQVLMAATYPGDVADAAAWAKAHPDAKGDAAVKQVANEPWDPSVQSLVAFPQALATLGQDPAWVQRLGDAFLAQPDDVMDAVQRLRRQAQSAGNLASNEYQKVSVQPAESAPSAEPAMGSATTDTSSSQSSTIVIEPTNPDVVYVPSYNPTTAYGTWAYPSYPPAYYPPPPGYYAGSALVSGLAFGVGVAITDSLWGDFDWDDDDIDIDVDRYNNINVNRQLNVNQNSWQHNSINRDGVPYRDRVSREQYGRNLDGAQQRSQFRGDDPQRAQAREQARASMQQRGIDAPARTNREARDRAQAAADRGGLQGRAGSADRTQARERAQAATDRSLQDRAGSTDRAQARERAQATTDRAQSRDRAQAGQHRPQAQQRPQASHERARQSQSNTQARDAARRQSQSRPSSHDNAFQGASRPTASRAQAQRGQASHAAASRPQGSRSAGKPVQRSSHPPQRQVARRH